MHRYETQILAVQPAEPEAAKIAQAATLIQAGELVVFPTETVYGLGANALNPQAVEQIFVAKGRPFNDPLIVHIAALETLQTLVSTLPPLALPLAQAFWPGPLTMIMPASSRVPGMVTAGLETVAIRMPRHPIALSLIRSAGLPIAAPSANRFMHVSPTTAQHVLADLQGRVPLILDGGACEVGVESTVLDLCSTIPTILRPGGISLEALRTIIPEVQVAAPRTKHDEEQQALYAPGQMLVHYAPSVPAYLFEGSKESLRQRMLTEIQRYHQQGQQVGVLLADEDEDYFNKSGATLYLLGKTPEQVATRLFAGLRTLEDAGVQVILCRSFTEEGLGRAVKDRLLKATGGNIIFTDEAYQ
ncbi:L-threonylcarbamoyladenylate synthase [Tengunoibacter tsumagoiensis]|uniref:Threonylcarbamoyl-AMP synthase n=1 Tax=Tengunoibacter tsumagoiensis TaxID=2014871 RepID=A0A402A0L3_9CHLR|nr:L-threonylcarbamoyladenylate synthase [Tengunoibacter tsumagoiensis]GCE12551.1 threonylcarbamoyl-AMP synthase [Tengunoibacter tsumagoiensis]